MITRLPQVLVLECSLPSRITNLKEISPTLLGKGELNGKSESGFTKTLQETYQSVGFFENNGRLLLSKLLDRLSDIVNSFSFCYTAKISFSKLKLIKFYLRATIYVTRKVELFGFIERKLVTIRLCEFDE